MTMDVQATPLAGLQVVVTGRIFDLALDLCRAMAR